MSRHASVLYGSAAYAVFLGTFLYAIAFVGNIVVPKTVDSGDPAPRIQCQAGHRQPIVFEPYFQAGGRSDGAWRLTWLSIAPVREADHPP